jgi:hypothetical protein
MKLTPRQAQALDEAIAFYLDRNTDGRFDILLMDLQRDPSWQALVKRAPGPEGTVYE